MARTQTARAKVQNASSRSQPKDLDVLDQDEVLRAMLAAQRTETLKDLEDGETEGNSEGESEASWSGSKSASDPDRHTKGRNRSADHGVSKPSRTPSPPRRPSANEASTSRVVLPARPLPPTNGKAESFPGENDKPLPATTFASLGLSPPLISALDTINIRRPTEIQSACVGPIMEGRDCIGGAKTGSGKTMAFALPIVERIARDPYGIWAVVLTPTRELAYQLTEQFLVVGRPLGLTTITVVGGMDMMAQAKELEQRPHIVVATPGRLCDLMRSDGMGGGKLSRVKVLVLDEADRLLTPTFAPELAYVFSQIPPTRQTCLFTATISEAILELANKPPPAGKRRPFIHRVESDILTVEGLKQKYLFVPSQVRDPYLYYLLQNPPSEIDAALRAPRKEKKVDRSKAEHSKVEHSKAEHSNKRHRPVEEEEEEEGLAIPSTIIFTQRCATAHLLHLLLNSLDIPSVPLHSHLTQPQRLQSLARFRAREIPVLVTTDVGSRGLDIPEVAMVVNWDCPRRSDDYVHRVGRTARAGRGGVAVTIVTERDVELVKMIEDEVGATMVELELPEETVLEKLNTVSLARRMATMEMHDSGFGERQATNKAKQVKRMRRDAAR